MASLGLRIRQGRCYHGLSLNVDMDLEPFSRINPCGYPGLRVTQLRDLGVHLSPATAAEEPVSYTHLDVYKRQVLRHAPDLDDAQVRVRASSAGRYQSVTVIVHARDRAQLDAIYCLSLIHI